MYGREWFEVVLQVVAGVDLLSAVREVGILPVQLGTAAGEVFGHRRHRCRANLGALEATHVADRQLTGQVRIFPEGCADARPPRLRGQIDLGV